jgi:hypothetical protein
LNNNKLHKNSAIFIAVVLVAGVITISSPFTAYAQQYEQEYNSYDPYQQDNSYSTYPTEDKPYECQKGPLEGFFTSSVEFCKIKFDDRKDDRRDNNGDNNGTQGPQGPQGPPGPPGPPGTGGGNGTNGGSAASIQIGFCNNTNFNINGLAQGQTQRQNIDSNVKETSPFGQNFTNGTTTSSSSSTGENPDRILNLCFNINNNDLANATFTGGAGQAQTGTGGAGDTGTGGNIIR